MFHYYVNNVSKLVVAELLIESGDDRGVDIDSEDVSLTNGQRSA